MLDDIATLTATPRAVTLGGGRHLVTPLSIEDIGALQAWVDEQFPDPYDLVNREIDRGRYATDEAGKPTRVPYTVAMQQFLLKTAQEQKEKGRRLIGTPEADGKLHTVEGMKRLLLLSLRKASPDFSIEQADALFRRMSVAEIANILSITNLDMVTSDPKAPTPSGTETPAPARNRKGRRAR